MNERQEEKGIVKWQEGGKKRNHKLICSLRAEWNENVTKAGKREREKKKEGPENQFRRS